MTRGRTIGLVPRREVPQWEVPYESDGRTLVRYVAPATGYDALALRISDRGGADIETPIWRTGTRVVHRNRTKLRQPGLARLMEHLRAGARLAPGAPGPAVS